MTPGPTPRKIRRRPAASRVGLGCAQLFLLPLIMSGIGLLGVCLIKLTLGLAGTRTEGRVETLKTEKDRKGRICHSVRFSFFANERKYGGESDVAGKQYRTLLVGERIPVVHLPVLPQCAPDHLPPGSMFPRNTWPLVALCLFWNGMLGVFVLPLFVEPFLTKRLLVHGFETQGWIVSKNLEPGWRGGTSYKVVYAYEVDGHKHEATESTSMSVYEKATEGQAVAVFFHPKNPAFSVAMELCDWEVVPPVP